MTFVKRGILAATAMAGAIGLASPAQALLLGQNFSYCTNLVYSGSVTTDTSACSGGLTSSTVVDPGNEITPSNRFIDLTDDQIIIDYGSTGSPSADLYILTGLTGISSLTLVGADPLGISTMISGNSLAILVASLPEGPGRTVFTVNAGAVPEPASWAMMIAGFGIVGFGLRRRVRQSVAYA